MMDIQDIIRKVGAFHENMQQLRQQFENCFQTVDSIINNENDIKINETLIKSLDTLLKNLKQLIGYEDQEMTPIIDDNLRPQMTANINECGNKPSLEADPPPITDINASNEANANHIKFNASADAKQDKIMHENYDVNSNDHIKYAYQPSAANKHNSHERKLRISPAIDCMFNLNSNEICDLLDYDHAGKHVQRANRDTINTKPAIHSNTPDLNINKVDVINDHAYAAQAENDKINPTENQASPDITKVNIGSKVYNAPSDVTPGQHVAHGNIGPFNSAIISNRRPNAPASIINNVNTPNFTGEISPKNVKQYPTVIQGDQTYLKLHKWSNQMALLTTAINHSQQETLVLILISHVFELLFTQRINQKQSVLPENIHIPVNIDSVGDKDENFYEDLD